MIFLTTKRAMRQGIAQSELRLNLLRLCAREPHTIHELIHAPEYPGIRISLFSIQSEINVSVELGELKSRALLVRVGKVPDPMVSGGTTELLRTSILAFLVSPELAWAEPRAYEVYLRAWFERCGINANKALALFFAFPELLFRAFYVVSADPEPPKELPADLPETEVIRIFGSYHIGDLPTSPKPLGFREVWGALRRPVLARGLEVLRKEELGGWGWLRFGHGKIVKDPPWDYPIPPLLGPELLSDRLRPNLEIPVLRGGGDEKRDG